MAHPPDSTALVTTLICAGAAAFMHWASVLSRNRKVPLRKLFGEMAATFVVGALIERLVGFVSQGAIDVVGRAIAACVVGFAYGPTALLIAAKYGVQKYVPDAPAPEPLDPPAKPAEPDPPAPAPAALPKDGDPHA